jgi:hypothetical protein
MGLGCCGGVLARLEVLLLVGYSSICFFGTLIVWELGYAVT